MSTKPDAVSREAVEECIRNYFDDPDLLAFLSSSSLCGAIDQLPPVQPDGPSGPGRSREEIKKYFEKEVLRNTCFDDLDDLLKDKTPIQTNAVRALITVELKGVWRGLNLAAKLFAEAKEENT